MYALRLLGGFALEGVDGGIPVDLPRRHAEALLALLAEAGSLGCTRDRLVMLLWPEQDTGHARHSLRKALHALRQALGPDSVVAMGDILRLEPTRVTSDLQDLRDSLAAGRIDDAVTAYRGPLLDGFHLAGAPEFERWLDELRARLQSECLAAARRLAEAAEAEGDWGRASEWWAHAVGLDPYNSAVVLRRMEALAHAGNRANAIREGVSHSALLKSELELDPDETFLEEMERIRRSRIRSAGRPPPRTVAFPAILRDDVAPAPLPARRHRYRRTGAIVASVIAIGALALIPRSPSPGSLPPGVLNPVRLTTWQGVEAAPSWSPDGRTLAFEADQSGNWDVWITPRGPGEAVNRTADHGGDDLRPTWSPDGRWIAFFSTREGGGYFIMPQAGGSARRIAAWPTGDLYPGRARWSPSGAEIAYAAGQRTRPRIEIVTVATGASRALPLPIRSSSNVVSELAWSPDGRWLAYVRANSLVSAITELWITDVSDGTSIQLADLRHRDVSPTWAPDSRTLYFVSDRGGTPDLWQLDLDRLGRPVGEARQVTSGVGMTAAALSSDARHVAYSRARTVRNVYRAPILPDRRARWADVTQLTFEEVDYESLDVGPDGRLLLSSDRSGNWDVFLLDPARGTPVPLTTDSALDAGPRWNADGTGIVFYSSRSGQREIWVRPGAGGPARQVTRGPGEKLYPTWSPNGLEVAMQHGNPPGISVVDVASGAIRRLATIGYSGKPDWSPDGAWIAYTTNVGSDYAVWRVPAAGGAPEQLTRAAGNLPAVPRWSQDGSRIYFLRRQQDGGDVWAVALDSRDEWPVTDLSGRHGRLGAFTLATAGRFVYFTWEESHSDIWVADLSP